MGDGTQQNPYTRDDVLRLIQEHGGKAEKLDLSNQRFVEPIDLSDLDLSGIKLINAHLFRANFNGSNLDRAIIQKAYLGYATFNPIKSKAASLKGVDLRNTNLHDAEFREADLSGAQFQETEIQAVAYQPQLQSKLLELLPASTERTDFRGANLFRANFKGCYFYGTKLEGAFIRGSDIFDAHLEGINWGNYKIGEEVSRDYYDAEYYYRRLKQWYTNAGMHGIAGEFYYHEKEATRKRVQAELATRHQLENIWNFLWLWIYKLLCGYGEKTLRIVGWAALFIFGLASAYFIINSVWEWSALWRSLYFSAVSFTSLGYGGWVDKEWINIENNWIIGLGVSESFLGVFMTGLFLVTFTRKMTR